ncbi:hypothetical protein [Streptomyces noursei]|uniref:hypothetical protein n=1 Tax=Streptomyces noursei TaxID=1971 RepID=UPI001674C20B|nr:hypothetical protein [Streptomyces noursei]MCZ1014039.1 hypothetical protein [Streptomyces noursei]
MADRLTEIAARVAAATPGPWLQRSDAGIVTDSDGHPLAVFGTSGPHCADAAFIAHAPEDVPWLLEQLEQARGIAVRLEQENARLREEALTDAAVRIERRAAQPGGVWLRTDQVCATLRRLAVDAGLPADVDAFGGVS